MIFIIFVDTFLGWGPSLLCICQKIFFMNDCFVKWFLFICWNDHVFFFIVLMWWVDFWILNPPCICDINRTLSWSIVCFISFKIQFANILSILIFKHLYYEGYWYVVFFFFGHIFLWLWFQGDNGLIILVRKFSFLLHLLKEFI